MIRGLIAFGAMSVSLVMFQNCGVNSFSVDRLNDFSSESTETESYIQSADLGWSTKANGVVVDSSQRVTRWIDITNRSLALYPPLNAAGTNLNLDLAGVLENLAGHNYVKLGPGASLAPAVSDLVELVSDRYTIMIVLRDLVFAPGTAMRILDLRPTSGENLGHIALDAFLENGDIRMRVYHFFGSDGYVIRDFMLNSQAAAGAVAVAIRFDKGGEELQLAVNGVLASLAPEITSPPPPQLAYAARVLTIQKPEAAYGSTGSFAIGEFGLYRTALSDQVLVSSSSSLYRKWSGVANVPTPTPVPPAATPPPMSGAQLYAARCASCHNPLATSTKRMITLSRLNAGIQNEQQMLSLGLLTTSERQAIVNALQ